MEILIPERIKQFAARAVREELYPYRAGTPRDPAYDVLPEPVMIAMNIRDYLRTTLIYDTEGQLLPGYVRIEGLQVPGCAYRHTAHNGYNSFFHIHSDYMPSSNVAFCDWNHFCNDYRFILKHGFKGRLETIREAKEKFAGNREKLDFLEACEIIVDSVHDLSARFGCEVPYEPAKSFDDALKSVWISFLLMPDSIGRLDDLLWPYYKHDLDAGIITREHAVEMIGEFLVKIFAHVGPGSHKSGDNTFVIGGYVPADERETGEIVNYRGMKLRDGFTELSEIILRTRVALPIWRPQINFRWTKQTKPETMKLVTEMNAKCADIVFVNDEIFLRAFERIGIEPRDAIDYTKIGCNEWSIMGMSHTGSDGFFNTCAALDEVMQYHEEELKTIDTFDKFYEFFLRYLDQFVTFMCDLADNFHTACAKDTNVLSSVMIQGCIEKAESITRGGAKYNASCWSAVGLIDLADSLSVIRQFVYDEKKTTMETLIDALKNDWQGHEALRADIRKNGRFFGNNDERTDELVNRLIADLDALANKRAPLRGGRFIFGCYIGYNSAHISMGLRTGAIPNGRRRGDALTAGIIAEPGMDKSGLTSYLASAARLNYTTLCAPLAVNLKLDKKLTSESDKLSALFETYMKLGGLQLQPDYLSAEDLKDAQIHPEKWCNLRVRITGFTGFFTRFDKASQDEIISRTEH